MQIIAHLFSDFIFQTQRQCNRKEKQIFSVHHLGHALIVGSTSYLLSFDLGFWKVALMIMFIHLLLDILKSWWIIRDKISSPFFIDQFLHIGSIVFFVFVHSYFFGINFIFEIEIKPLIIITGFIFCAKPSNILIKHLFKAFAIDIPKRNSGNPEEITLPNAGRLIGIIERFLTLPLIIMGQYEAVGLIIAAKSILRYNDAQKNEYVLVGTLLSFGIAIFWGVLINLIG